MNVEKILKVGFPAHESTIYWRKKILLAVFIIWESKSSNPMLAVHFFKVPQFSLGVMTRLLAFIAFSSTMFLMPFYLIGNLDMKHKYNKVDVDQSFEIFHP